MRLLGLLFLLFASAPLVAGYRRHNKTRAQTMERAFGEDLRLVPGSEWLGLGVDMGWDVPEALRASVFKFTTTNQVWQFQGKNADVSYLDKSKMRYYVSDQVQVTEIGSITESESSAASWADFRDTPKRKSKDKRWKILFGIIRFSFKMRQVKERFGTKAMATMTKKVQTELFRVQIKNEAKTSAFSDVAKKEMEELNKYEYSLMPELYHSFITKYGTHFISGAKLGAALAMDSSFQFDSENKIDDFMTALGIGFHFGISITLEFGVTKYEEKNKFARKSISNWEISGGIPDNKNFAGLMAAQTAAQIAQTKQKIDEWKKTMALNPFPLEWETQRLTDVFVNGKAKSGMDSAINCYYTPSCYRNVLKTSDPALA